MRNTSIQNFQQEGYFQNSFFKQMKMFSTQSDSKSIKGSGRSSPSLFRPLATLCSKNSMIYKFVYKTDISSSLPFPSIIAALCADARIPAILDDTLIPQEPPIAAEAMARTREARAKNPRQTRQATPPQQQPQFQHQQEFSSGFYTHFDTSMSQVYRRLDQQQEENRRSFEAINTKMDRMDDQLSFLCYSNQMANEQMLSPYQNTARQFKKMEMQGIPVTMANLAIHRQREEEINQERMRYNQILQEVAAQQAREANKGKTREVVLDSEDEFASSKSEEFYSFFVLSK
ncbi:hypothetical protein PIB30_104967 [Stylosanthes scabra]|uniref:Uncharacterized protein n=1 Tax=Stylosanthes scabra TaxID=79078 RepID=A0ABU6YXY1_9FABA|nr:hypothetical protein [Stylosanthes scabra]